MTKNIISLQKLFIYLFAFFALSTGCSQRTEKAGVPPVPPVPSDSPPSNPQPAAPPINVVPPLKVERSNFKSPVQCEGESFSGDSKADLKHKFLPDQLNAMTAEYSFEESPQELGTTFFIEGERTTIKLAELQSSKILYSVSMEPFRGFAQGGVSKGQSGGWLQCESNEEVFENLVEVSKYCKGYWYDRTLKRNPFEFRLKDSVGTTAVENEPAFHLKYELSSNFALIDIVDPTSQEPMASAVVDRYFKNAKMEFFLSNFHVTIECDEEVP